MTDLIEQKPLARWPKYLKLKQELTSRLRSGHFDPRVPLPSEKSLAILGGVSVRTVRQALAEMADEGLVRREQGRGTFVTQTALQSPAQQLNVFTYIAPQIREGTSPSFIHGFEEASAGLQYQVQVGNSQNSVDRQASLVLGLIDQMVGGVAILPITSTATPAVQIRQLQKHNIPVVCCHRTVEGATTPSVVFRGFEVGHQTASAFLERGHRHIAFIYLRPYSMTEQYELGMRAAIATHHESASCELSLVEYRSYTTPQDPSERAALHAALGDLLSRPNRPTAIFCGNIVIAEQIYLDISAGGLEIPRDLSLISFGSTWRGSGLAERIACICVDEHDIGACAARLLHEMRSGQRPIDSGEQIVFPTSLFEGETLASISQVVRET